MWKTQNISFTFNLQISHDGAVDSGGEWKSGWCLDTKKSASWPNLHWTLDESLHCRWEFHWWIIHNFPWRLPSCKHVNVIRIMMIRKTAVQCGNTLKKHRHVIYNHRKHHIPPDRKWQSVSVLRYCLRASWPELCVCLWWFKGTGHFASSVHEGSWVTCCICSEALWTDLIQYHSYKPLFYIIILPILYCCTFLMYFLYFEWLTLRF